MAKKKSSNGMLYLIGMALVVIGFFLPMFKAGPLEPNGWDFLNFKEFGFVTIGGLLILIGAVLGVLAALNVVKGKSLKLIALVVSIVGGVVLFIGFNDNRLYQVIAKGFLKHAYIGFYVVLAGWVAGLIGTFSK